MWTGGCLRFDARGSTKSTTGCDPLGSRHRSSTVRTWTVRSNRHSSILHRSEFYRPRNISLLFPRKPTPSNPVRNPSSPNALRSTIFTPSSNLATPTLHPLPWPHSLHRLASRPKHHHPPQRLRRLAL